MDLGRVKWQNGAMNIYDSYIKSIYELLKNI